MILALLFTHIHIKVRYDGEGSPSAVFYFLGIFRKKLYPLPKRPKRKKKNKKIKAERKKPKTSVQKDKTSRLSGLRELRSLIAVMLIRMPRTFTLRIKRLIILIGSEDAARTALLYGAIASSLSFLTEWLDRHLLTLRRARRATIVVDADFSSEEIVCDLELVLTSSLFRLLGLALTALLPHFLKRMRIKRRRQRARRQADSKNLPNHEK